MTYKINKTDGSLLAEVIDSSINQTAADITLIGKNVIGYGEYINENFVRLLENFASSTQPNFPITGQLWYDLTENRLKIYDGNGFKVGNGPVVSSSRPVNLTQGDFWIDKTEKQLWFHDGANLYPASKIWKSSQGISGFETATISDTFGTEKTVVLLWSAGNLLGIFSHYPEFTPSGISSTVVFNSDGASGKNSYQGNIVPGFNPNIKIQDFKFNTTSAAAAGLIDSFGVFKPTETFVNSEDSVNFTYNNGKLNPAVSVSSPFPLKLGAYGETEIYVDPQGFVISVLNNASVYVNAITVKSGNQTVGIFTDMPRATLDVNGNAIVAGTLTAEGAVTGKIVRMPSYTTVERDALQPQNGDMIFNVTVQKIQAHANGAWVDLH